VLFLNPWLLLGLAGVLVPVVLHMMRRRSAKPLDWGAMRFLFDTVALRRRRMEWEDMLLMAARCLLVALLALAVARPFVPPDSAIPWLFVLPLALLGLAVFGASFVVSGTKWRWLTRGAAVFLLLMAGCLILIEHRLNLRRFQTSGGRDMALVIDASSSMTIRRAGGRTAFEEAVEEAVELVKEAPRGTAFTVILGGPAPEQMTGTPLTHRADVIEVLESLRPVGGLFRAHDALGVSLLNLSRGSHAGKEILVFTDGQRLGWRLESPSAWTSFGKALEGMPRPPKLVMRTLPPPASLRNLAVSSLTLSRELVGTDREVAIRVTVENTGTEAVTPEPLEVTAGGRALEPVGLGQLAPGQRETVEFRHRFEEPGPAVVEARLEAADDLAADDRRQLVVSVRERLPVLLVDGNAAGGFFERAAGFTALALAPSAALLRGEDAGDSHLMAPRVVAGPDVASVGDFDAFGVVVLADVARLPEGTARRLASFAAGGGGLLILAGLRAEADFYNLWSGPDGEVAPLWVGGFEVDDEGLFPAPQTFAHESLALFKDERESDLGEATLTGCRRTERVKRGGSVAARLSNGEPLLAARNYGRGRIMMATAGFDARSGNLPTRRSFVPMVHELVSWLAGAGEVSLNVEAGWRPAVALPGGGGLRGRYYRNRGKSARRGIAMERIDPMPHFDWGEEAPAGGMNRENFRVEWQGQLVPPAEGRYTFEAEVDGGLEMKVAGRTVLVDRRDSLVRKPVTLEAGVPVPVSVDYQHRGGRAYLRLFWNPPGGRREPVPAKVLIPVLRDGEAEVAAEGKATDPRGAPRRTRLTVGRRGRLLEVDGAAVPGLYELEVPGRLRGEVEEFARSKVPLVVRRDPEESRLTSLGEEDRELIRNEIDLVQASSLDDVVAILTGRGFGHELWKFLAVTAFLLLLVEAALARWISKSRRAAEDVKVEFEDRGGPGLETIERMRRLRRAG